jgi:hypothetical protein
MPACRACWRPVRTCPACTKAATATAWRWKPIPGLLARELIGRRSYKSDDLAKQTPERLAARTDLLAALEAGTTRLGLRLGVSLGQHAELLADARGDDIDAVLCLLQAAWGLQRAQSPGPGHGLPAGFDGLEGWIVTA